VRNRDVRVTPGQPHFDMLLGVRCPWSWRERSVEPPERQGAKSRTGDHFARLTHISIRL
jgi:hypothetical protein